MYLSTVKRLICAGIAVLLSLQASSCIREEGLSSETYYDVFDTFVTVMAYGEEPEDFEKNCEAIKDTLYDCSRLFDIYREYDGINNLATVNKNAGKKETEVDARIVSLLEFSLEAYELTGGEVNVAMGSVLKLWHDCREKNSENPGSAPIPSAEELRLAGEHTDISSVVIDRERSSVYIKDPLCSIDVGAVAKGFAADELRAVLAAREIDTGYAINLGGNVITIGKKSESEGWSVSVRDPYSDGTTGIYSVTAEDRSLVTSGVYERSFEYGGVKYHHVIDKDTASPSEYFDSVSVLGERSALCDVLSTALMCMPLEEGMALVESIEGVDALWIGGGEINASSGFPANAHKS